MFEIPTSVTVLILLIIAVICIYQAVDHAISDYFQYKYMEKLADMLKDGKTRELFVYVKPYLAKYLDLLDEKVKAYIRDVGSLDVYRKFIMEVKKHKDNSPSK